MAKLSEAPGIASILNYKPGVTIADALDKALYPGLSITAMTVAPSQIEQGASAAVTVAWTVSGTITGQTLEGEAVAVGDRSKVFPAVSASNVYDLTVQDAGAPGGAVSASRSVSVTVLPRRFWGVADAAALGSAGVVALAGSELSSARAKSLTVEGGAAPGKYAYYAYPASLGDPASYKIYGFDEVPVKTTVSVTTAAGATLSYIVLRSPNKLTGSIPVEIS
ncbi:hypothetical protein QUC32_13015 [Novosphingobium resinovorum]|uniref:hypothetical protein n=1 Tax=Novosphingobium TaxID=165696 RepID=UPI001B3C830F|nr:MULTISPECIES: hypothetical protein [Novosphingobium]MBF7010598.1 hypothetical protein [Novosphingobium sp. HR1a]WJM28595.1 hypothetical protein QUC32_13015 [Novosphingobium resinovorum]